MSHTAETILHELQARGIKLGLHKVRLLLARLGEPAAGVRVVQVAGTNGKGSVVFGLEAIARVAGVRTGTFISPHLIHPGERVRIDGGDLPLVEFERRVVSLAARLGEWAAADPELGHVTYFEFVFGLAWEVFLEQGVELIILEVGMGGRLDATSAARTDLACITSIDLDHEEYLGEGLAAIAREKVGIAREGVPLVVGPLPEAAERAVQVRALEVGAPLRVVAPRDDLRNGMWGAHQRINAALAWALAEELGLPTDDAARAALALARVPGRCERFPGVPEILIDGAHNPAAAVALAATLRRHPADGPTDLLVSVGRAKDLRGVLAPLVPLCRNVHVTEYTSGRPPTPAAEVAGAVLDLGGAPVVHVDAAAALEAARAAATPGERLLVTGSLFLAGEVRALLLGESPG